MLLQEPPPYRSPPTPNATPQTPYSKFNVSEPHNINQRHNSLTADNSRSVQHGLRTMLQPQQRPQFNATYVSPENLRDAANKMYFARNNRDRSSLNFQPQQPGHVPMPQPQQPQPFRPFLAPDNRRNSYSNVSFRQATMQQVTIKLISSAL